jgi:hypothetical protein
VTSLTRAVVVLALLAAACHAKVGPFVPAHAVACSWNGDCPHQFTCRFPGVNTRAVCMHGDNELDP